MFRYLITSALFLASNVLAESAMVVGSPSLNQQPTAASTRVMFTIHVPAKLSVKVLTINARNPVIKSKTNIAGSVIKRQIEDNVVTIAVP